MTGLQVVTTCKKTGSDFQFDISPALSLKLAFYFFFFLFSGIFLWVGVSDIAEEFYWSNFFVTLKLGKNTAFIGGISRNKKISFSLCKQPSGKVLNLVQVMFCPLKTSKNQKVFWRFQGVWKMVRNEEKGNIGWKRFIMVVFVSFTVT